VQPATAHSKTQLAKDWITEAEGSPGRIKAHTASKQTGIRESSARGQSGRGVKVTNWLLLIGKFRKRAAIKNAVFWGVTPCGSCKNRRFGGT
jgi:hypothetical protein